MKILNDINNAKKELEEAKKELAEEVKAAKQLQKQNKQLLGQIDTAEKRGGVLLLSDLNEDLIQKLASMTDDNVFVLFCTDGTRLEIHKEGLVNKKILGRIS